MTALRKYTDLRSWFRHLAKSSVHAGIGALISGAGTFGAEAVAPVALKGVALDPRQMLAVFLTAAFWAALHKIHQATAETTPPIPQ